MSRAGLPIAERDGRPAEAELGEGACPHKRSHPCRVTRDPIGIGGILIFIAVAVDALRVDVLGEG